MTRRLPWRGDRGPDGVSPVRGAGAAGLVLQDASGRILVASERAAQLLEVDGPEALTGQPALFEGGTVVRSDGSELPLEQQPGAMALRTGQVHEDCVLGFRRPGAETRWFQMRAEPLFKVGGVVPYAAVSRFVLLSQTPGGDADRRLIGIRPTPARPSARAGTRQCGRR
jgi:PAS domain-containing protein